MNAFLFHLVGGDSLYTGLALSFVAMALAEFLLARSRAAESTESDTPSESRPSSRRDNFVRSCRLIAAVGMALAALSSAPLAWWMWLGIVGGWLAWTALAGRGSSAPVARSRIGALALFLIAGGGAIATELQWRRTPPLVDAAASRDRFVVIGDSLSAGLEDDETTWPQLAAESLPMPVENLAYPGATLASALEQVERMARGGRPLVFLMIGGNDLLATGASSHAFAADLDALLAAVRAKAGPDASLLLVELPLPPLGWRFGHAQRDAARRHGAILLPKRLLASVLAPAENTTDGLHLSAKGKEAMAGWVVVAATS